MKFKKILFHTRFRELAFNSLKTFADLKCAGLQEIVLTHVIPREEVAFVPYGGYLKEDLDRIKHEAGMRFKDWQNWLDDQQIKSSVKIVSGATNAKILSIAEEENVDMIVVGRKKRTTLEKVYVGSHILDILRRSTVPTLMSKYMVQFEWQEETLTRTNDKIYKRPLLATDWSLSSKNALDAIIALDGAVEKAIITHIIGSKITKGRSDASIKKLEEESRKRLAQYADVTGKAGIETETHLSMGKTVSEIIRASRDYNASMIVMGKTGKDWFHEYWLGGASHQVAELSELPVMLVP